MPAVSSSAFVVVSAGMLLAAAIDIRTRRIPNALTATMAGLGLGLAGAGASGIPLWASVAGFALGLGLMLPGHLLGGTGAGDVKLMAAMGAIVGPGLVVSAFLFTAVAGGVLAVMVAARRRQLAATLAGTGQLVTGCAETRDRLRTVPSSSRFAYGPAIAAGSILAALVG